MRTCKTDSSGIMKEVAWKRINIVVLALCSLLSVAFAAHAEKITVAAAADLKFAMDEVAAEFRNVHPGEEVEIIYGSSGKAYTQIQQGAPYDLYFSADIAFPRELIEHGFAASASVTPYARGRIVLWSTTRDASKMTPVSLADPAITHVATANPQHAPYGRRAEEALRAANLWNTVESKMVYGENITQAAQFVQTGNAQVGIIALSLAVSPELSSKGGYYLIPDNLHEPLEQGFIILKRARHNALARQFADYMSTPPARAIMTRYGFVLPGEAVAK
jgi:molybdate transport system substrate-binding protein